MTNDEINEKAMRELPLIKKFSLELILLATETMRERVYFSEEDHFAFMGLLSLSQQTHFYDSLIVLVEGHSAVPAGLIARAMMEGMVLLTWCAQDIDSRPIKWRAYALVHDFRLMKEKKSGGEEIDPATRDGIESRLHKYGHLVLSEKAKRLRQEGRELPKDPYIKKWPEVKIYEMFKEVGASDLYTEVYKPLSELMHWSVTSFAEQTQHEGSALGYTAESSSRQEALVLTSGFHSLFGTLSFVQLHLQLEGLEQAKNLRDRYIEALQ